MSRENKLAYIKFFPGDWRKDPGVQALDFRDRGIWFEMLLLMFESSERGRLLLNGKPMPDEATARLLGITKTQYLRAKKRLLQYNVARIDEDGALYNARMIHDEKERLISVENGKKGGRPPANKRNQNHNQNGNPTHNPEDNPDVTQGETLHSHSHSHSQNTKTPLPPLELPSELDTEKFRASWAEWEQHRNERKDPMTPLAITKAMNKLAALGEQRAIEAINHSIENGWKGIYPPDERKGSKNGAKAKIYNDTETEWS